MTAEKREYYRVSHPLVIEYRSVTPDEINDPELQQQFSQTPQAHLSSDLAEIDAELQHLLTRMGDSNSPVLIYLKLLDRKVNLIASAVTMPDISLLPASDTQIVNLSQGGIRFHVPDPVSVNTYLALTILLPHSHAELQLYAKVLRCLLDKPSNLYELACEFLPMQERYRTMLARFVLEVEANQRKSNPDSH